ncbi:hypothetical protein KDH_78870 [Dictyobacter sp. S3.2.2.5]|uniref:Uncharacterized protein n=1 Tax=Dictyobacter halimunensis TaxID=3026934 RepID=A0ABQ6G5H0_9CHLR|nr:hypothetical protein KDH_78870 [Dictyobacter sp. S3.2.2.5]
MPERARHPWMERGRPGTGRVAASARKGRTYGWNMGAWEKGICRYEQ